MLIPGTDFRDQYLIIRELGRGGGGAVYLAKDQVNRDRFVAIKKTNDFSRTSKLILREEAKLLAGLDHPNVVQVYDTFDDAEGVFIVMQYVEGRDLWQATEHAIALHSPLPVAQVMSWMLQACTGLAYLHKKNIVHRDIKPHNMRVRPDGTLVLIDLGIAKRGSGKATGSLKQKTGTPPFAPFEQYRGGVTFAADVYALGISMYVMLTAQLPPEAGERMGHPEPIRPMVSPSQINPAISRQLEQIIMKATELSSTNRYQTGSEMLDALSTYQTVSSLSMMPKTSSQNSFSTSASRRAGVGSTPKFCRNCGSRQSSNAKYCGHCGTRQIP